MLSLEVVGPGGSLSMLLLLHHSGEMPVGECPGRQQWRRQQKVATGWQWHSFFGWGCFSGGGVEEAAFVRSWIFSYVIFFVILCLAFFCLIWPRTFGLNTGLFCIVSIFQNFKCYVFFFLWAASHFHIGTVPLKNWFVYFLCCILSPPVWLEKWIFTTCGLIQLYNMILVKHSSSNLPPSPSPLGGGGDWQNWRGGFWEGEDSSYFQYIFRTNFIFLHKRKSPFSYWSLSLYTVLLNNGPVLFIQVKDKTYLTLI
jgi:hypothetical protein